MNAIRIRRTIDSETLTIPELRGLIGREVEIIVLEESPRFVQLETEATFFGLAPPPQTPTEREANLAALREMAKTDPTMAAFLEAVESQDYDVEAVIRARGLQEETWDASR